MVDILTSAEGFSSSAKLIRLPLATMLWDEHWCRRRLDRQHLERIAHAYKSRQPVAPPVVAMQPGGALIIDGRYRLIALQAMGETDVDAHVISVSTERARWLSFKANLGHALPLTPQERRSALETFVTAGAFLHGRQGLMSWHEIASSLHVEPVTGKRWMQKDFPRIAADIDRKRGRRVLEGAWLD